MKFLLLLTLWCAALPFVPSIAAEGKAEGGWSAEVLNQILRAEPASAGKPSAGNVAREADQLEMALRTYHLSHLRIGEAGKAQNVMAILGRLLPAGSSLNPDVPANSVHVLTTASAHAAVWEYLSAVDVPEATMQRTDPGLPEEVRSALKKLAESDAATAKLLGAIDGLKAGVSAEMSQLNARQRYQSRTFLIAAGSMVVVLAGLLAWMNRRRPSPASTDVPTTTTLALAPDQLATALLPAQDKMRNDMMGLLNEVAIKLQAQHNDQQKLVHEQQVQLEHVRHALAEERKQFISEAGTMVVQAVERVDATTAKLVKQQDKVAELVEELQTTVRELDETKDSLRTKEIELEQERAKIAALSILLEEGGSFPLEAATRAHPVTRGQNGGRAGGVNGTSGKGVENGSINDLLCTIPDPISPETAALPERPPQAESRFQFLSPNHPET